MTNSIKAEEGGYWINVIVFKTSDKPESIPTIFDRTGRFSQKTILSWSPLRRLKGLANDYDRFSFFLDRGLDHRWFVDKWVNKKTLKHVLHHFQNDISEEKAIEECTETIVRLQTRLSDTDAVEYKIFVENLLSGRKIY